MNSIEILSKKDAISVTKDNGTQVDYFIFDEFEIHQNRISPHSIQEWHKHEKIEEIIVVTSGDICVKWKEDNQIKASVLSKGNVLRVGNSIHTIENMTDRFAEFNVFRMLPTGKATKEIIKKDKKIVGNPES